MRSLVFVMACALAAATAAAQDGSSPAGAAAAVASKGQMVVAANGARLGTVYRVNADGSAQIIIDGKMVTIPAATLSTANGRLTTSLSKSEVSDLH
jgi:hypothetical protein